MVEIKVERLKQDNVIILIASTIIFVVSAVVPDIFFYIRYILVAIGAILLVFSYFITAMDYYRQLFTAYPQKISMLVGDSNPSNSKKIEVFPYIIDNDRIQFFVHSIEISLSPNYDLDSISLNGNNFNIVAGKNLHSYQFDVKNNGNDATKFRIIFRENGIDVNSRRITYTIRYSKNEKSKFIFKETHIID